MEYGYPQRRKSKNDKRAKARFNKYKRGGSFRSSEGVKVMKPSGERGSSC